MGGQQIINWKQFTIPYLHNQKSYKQDIQHSRCIKLDYFLNLSSGYFRYRHGLHIFVESRGLLVKFETKLNLKCTCYGQVSKKLTKLFVFFRVALTFHVGGWPSLEKANVNDLAPWLQMYLERRSNIKRCHITFSM